MRWLGILVLLLSSRALAYNCETALTFHPQDRIYTGCRITSGLDDLQTFAFPPEEVSAGECLNFCVRNIVVPVYHEGNIYPIRVVRDEVILLMNIFRQFLREHSFSIAPEHLLESYLIEREFNSNSEDSDQDQDFDLLFQTNVEAHTHQRNAERILPKDAVKTLSKKEIDDRISEEVCSICATKVKDSIESGKEVVQTNCQVGAETRHHYFCKDCLAEHYHYQQNCPNCRCEIR